MDNYVLGKSNDKGAHRMKDITVTLNRLVTMNT